MFFLSYKLLIKKKINDQHVIVYNNLIHIIMIIMVNLAVLIMYRFMI